MKKKIILGLVCLLTLSGCGKIPTLQNGEEAVITFSKDDIEYQISVEDLYEELKNNYGLEATVTMIDRYILETEFADYVETAEEYAEYYVEAMVEAYGDEDTLLEAIQYYTNYSTIEAYQDYLYLSYMQSYALEEYAKLQISDDEIEEYYENDVYGDVELYHILIVPDVTDDMDDDEVEAAEEEALTLAKDIIKRLKNADDDEVLDTFIELVAEYSDDESTIDNDGNLGYINYGDLDEEYDELLDAAFKLEDGEYSTSVITTELGYHVIYRNASKDKEDLEDIKDTIIETLAEELMNSDSTLSVNSMIYWRDLYNTTIIDSELNRQYGIYVNSLINSIDE